MAKFMFEKTKRKFWNYIEPHWPKLRDLLVKHGIVWHEPGRQRWHLGWLPREHTKETFVKFMESHGFQDHFIAWVDEDEVMSLRKLDGKKHQYHVRLFKDGEIRGHYEFSPEGNLLKHFFEIGMEERREQFMAILKGWIKE